MSMSDSQYNMYHEKMKYIRDYGTRDEMEALYYEILVETQDRENLKRLDSMYNDRWTIDF